MGASDKDATALSHEYVTSQAYDDSPGDDIDKPLKSCSSENWIQLRYLYAEGTGLPKAGRGVPHARYVVQHVNSGEPGGEILVQGTLDADGYACVPLPNDVTEVEVYFHDDPVEETNEKSSTISAQDTSLLERIEDQIKAGGKWVWGVIQGDWNEDASLDQIITDAVLTAVPYVDQAADIRDVSAALKKLIYDKRYNDIDVWFDLFACSIGLIPTLGSLAKGLLKVLRRSPEKALSWFIVNFNKIFTSNAYRWVKDFIQRLPGYAMDAAAKVEGILARVQSRIQWVLSLNLLPDIARRKLEASLHVIQEKVQPQVRLRFAELAAEYRKKLLEALEKGLSVVKRSLTRRTLVVRQLAKSKDELVEAITRKFGQDFNNAPLRKAYEAEVQALSRYRDELVDAGRSREEIARLLHQARRDLGVKYKDATPQPLRDYIYYKNNGRYGDPLGPSFERLLNKYSGDYERIIDSALQPNPDINKLLEGFQDWLMKQPDDYLLRFVQ